MNKQVKPLERQKYRALQPWTVGGTAEGYVVDVDEVNVSNWLAGEGLDESQVQRIVAALRVNVDSKAIAVLKSINVDEDLRGDGIGGGLLSEFLHEAGSAAVLLVSDRAESQTEGFDLEAWYQRKGFARFTQVSGGAMMIRPVNLADHLHSAVQGEQPVKPMTYGHGCAIMVLAGNRMGLAPALVEEATRHLEGGTTHPMTGAAIEREAVDLNNRLRVDATLIAQANAHAEDLKLQYGFVASNPNNQSGV